jgi:hypothetical protein
MLTAQAILFTRFISIFNTIHSNTLLHYNALRKTFFTSLTSVKQTIYEALKKNENGKSQTLLLEKRHFIITF